MKQATSIYLKKLISLALVIAGSWYVREDVEYYALIPLALLVYSFLYASITKKKPPYLFGLKKVDDYITKKGGFWNLFKLILTLFGFLYDIIVWVIWSVYLIFEITIDIILLIKEIIFWIFHAIIWFLSLFVPPLVFLYRMFLHYVINWIWWLYRISFRYMASSVKFNYFVIGLWGGVIATFSVLLFYYIAILFNQPGLIAIGVVLSTLPLAWAFGEISSINENNMQNEPYYEVSSNFENGFEAVKYVLYYVVAFLILFIIQAGLYFLGLIPDTGMVFLGFDLNINIFISIILVILFVILIFASLIIPTHLLKTEEQETPFHDIINFISVILKKGLQYILVTIPSGFFGIILMVVPALIVGIALWFSLQVKDNVLERRIKKLDKKSIELSEVERYKLNKKIDKLQDYRIFPVGIIKEARNRKEYDTKILSLNQKIKDQEDANSDLKVNYLNRLDEYNSRIATAENLTDGNSRNRQLELLNIELEGIKNDYNKSLSQGELKIIEYQIDIQYNKNKKRQLPVALFFVILCGSLFGGLVLAIYIGYLGNVYYYLYPFKSEDPSYFSEQVKEAKAKDRKQPLLGFTLLVITVLVIIYLMAIYYNPESAF